MTHGRHGNLADHRSLVCSYTKTVSVSDTIMHMALVSGCSPGNDNDTIDRHPSIETAQSDRRAADKTNIVQTNLKFDIAHRQGLACTVCIRPPQRKRFSGIERVRFVSAALPSAHLLVRRLIILFKNAYQVTR